MSRPRCLGEFCNGRDDEGETDRRDKEAAPHADPVNRYALSQPRQPRDCGTHAVAGSGPARHRPGRASCGLSVLCSVAVERRVGVDEVDALGVQPAEDVEVVPRPHRAVHEVRGDSTGHDRSVPTGGRSALRPCPTGPGCAVGGPRDDGGNVDTPLTACRPGSGASVDAASPTEPVPRWASRRRHCVLISRSAASSPSAGNRSSMVHPEYRANFLAFLRVMVLCRW